MNSDNNINAFLALLRAGLWEHDVRLQIYTSLDFSEIYRLAEEQSVLGTIAAGIEHVVDVKIPQGVALTFVGNALQLEQRNTAMNSFLVILFDSLKREGIYSLLVKGQGIAQCYERPLWRASGDVDLLLSANDYDKAKRFLDNKADSFKEGSIKDLINLHREYIIDGWMVELHGTLNTSLSNRIDRVVDSVKDRIFFGGEARVWQNGEAAVYLPSPSIDVILVFTHILQHFFNGGVGLRQLCDLSRLLWTYRDTIDKSFIKAQLKDMGLMTEWRGFGCLMVNYLGLPEEAMPFYDESYKSRAKRILSYILEVGNFGHNKDTEYQSKYPFVIRKVVTFLRQTKDSFKLAFIFPIDSPKFLINYFLLGSKKVINGE